MDDRNISLRRLRSNLSAIVPFRIRALFTLFAGLAVMAACSQPQSEEERIIDFYDTVVDLRYKGEDIRLSNGGAVKANPSVYNSPRAREAESSPVLYHLFDDGSALIVSRGRFRSYQSARNGKPHPLSLSLAVFSIDNITDPSVAEFWIVSEDDPISEDGLVQLVSYSSKIIDDDKRRWPGESLPFMNKLEVLDEPIKKADANFRSSYHYRKGQFLCVLTIEITSANAWRSDRRDVASILEKFEPNPDQIFSETHTGDTDIDRLLREEDGAITVAGMITHETDDELTIAPSRTGMLATYDQCGSTVKKEWYVELGNERIPQGIRRLGNGYSSDGSFAATVKIYPIDITVLSPGYQTMEKLKNFRIPE